MRCDVGVVLGSSHCLDLASFKALYHLPSAVAELDDLVVMAGKGPIRHPDVLLQRLVSFGITTVGELERLAKEESNTVAAFAHYWVNALGAVDPGIGVFYLLYVLAWKTNNEAFVHSHLNESSIGDVDERSELAKKILRFNYGV